MKTPASSTSNRLWCTMVSCEVVYCLHAYPELQMWCAGSWGCSGWTEWMDSLDSHERVRKGEIWGLGDFSCALGKSHLCSYEDFHSHHCQKCALLHPMHLCGLFINQSGLWSSLDHITAVIFMLLRCTRSWLISTEHKKFFLIFHDTKNSLAFDHLQENEEEERREKGENVNN